MIIQDTQRYFQKHKTKTRVKKVVKFFTGAFFFFFVLWLFTLTPLVRIRDYSLTIAHSPANFLKEEEVRQYIESLLDDTEYLVSNRVWYLLKQKEIEQLLQENFPEIATAKQSWHFFNKVTIEVVERAPFVQVCDDVATQSTPVVQPSKKNKAKKPSVEVQQALQSATHQRCTIIDVLGVPFRGVTFTNGTADVNADGHTEQTHFPEIKIKEPVVLMQQVLKKEISFCLRQCMIFCSNTMSTFR